MIEKEYNEKQQEKLDLLRGEIKKGIDDIEAGRILGGETAMARRRARLMTLKAEQSVRDDS